MKAKDKIEQAAEYYAHNNFNMHETNSYKELKKGFKAGVDWEAIKNWAKPPIPTKDKIVEDLKRECEIRILKEALAEYIKWFGDRETNTDKLIEVNKQCRGVVLAMLLQEEINKL